MRNQGCSHPGGRRALAVGHQVDFGMAEAVDVVRQLLAPLLTAVDEGHAGGIDLCATALKIPGNGMEVVHQAADGVEPGDAVNQDNRVAGLGVAGVA